ncbi:hypothetical protein GCM10027168_64830 [Streptomyces capparidis]
MTAGGARAGLLSVVTGNTPRARGGVVDELVRACPRAVVLSVSVHGEGEGYPLVQRLLHGEGRRLRGAGGLGVAGAPGVVLRQDLLCLRRGAHRAHVVLALPGDVDVLPLLVELWRAGPGGGSLGDHYRPARVLVGLDPEAFLADLRSVRRAVRPWNGWGPGGPLTQAEAAVRQVEAADALILTPAGAADPRCTAGVGSLAARLNGHAEVVPPAAERPMRTCPGPGPRGGYDEWRARLEPVSPPLCRGGGAGHDAESVLWRARRPLHPGRLADALPVVMRGVVRGRGHLWLTSRPDSVVTWRSAGSHLELREAGRWLEPGARGAWEAASPQRRTLASWFWDDRHGERRSELVLTGVGLEERSIRAALDSALLTDGELSLGRERWTAVHDPLLGGSEPS